MGSLSIEPADGLSSARLNVSEVVLLERALRALLDAEAALAELSVFHDHPDVPLDEVRIAVTLQRQLIGALMQPGPSTHWTGTV